MMIKKVDTSFVRRVQRGKTTVFGGILRFNQHPPMLQKLPKGVFGCFTTSHEISNQNIDRKILFVKKIKITTRWLISF